MIDVAAIKLRYEALSPVLDERGRRRCVAAEALAAGWGGIAAVCEATAHVVSFRAQYIVDAGCGHRRIGKGKARLVVKVAEMPGSVQDFYLAEIRRRMVPVTIVLVNGSELRGIVKAFDPFTITLEYDSKTHLIYKHAISTISPQSPVTIAAPAPQAEP